MSTPTPAERPEGALVRLGTRGSALALTQSGMVARALEAACPGVRVELVTIKTTGDKITDVALAKIGDRGLFVKEIEQALLEGEVDFAVHSMKDMPTCLPEGLLIAAVPRRLPPHDCMVSLTHASFAALPQGARIGTGSLRRRAWLRHVRPDIHLDEIRGNLPTRIRKLREQGLDATILALSGLSRLGVPGLLGDEPGQGSGAALGEVPPAVRFSPPASWGEQVTGEAVWIVPLDPAACLPAVGQGALCLEAAANRHDILAMLARLDDPESHAAVRAERALMRRLEGGCQVPIGAWSRVDAGRLHLAAMLADPSGAPLHRAEVDGPMHDGERLGIEAAERLLAQGGQVVLDALRA